MSTYTCRHKYRLVNMITNTCLVVRFRLLMAATSLHTHNVSV